MFGPSRLEVLPKRYGWYGCSTAESTGESSRIPRVYAVQYGSTGKTLLCVPPPPNRRFEVWIFLMFAFLVLGSSRNGTAWDGLGRVPLRVGSAKSIVFTGLGTALRVKRYCVSPQA